jgi:hypothetical protein
MRSAATVLVGVAAALLAGLAPGVAGAAEVSREVVIDAAPGRVWQIVGPFCSISEWHPLIARCTEESIGGEPHRRLTTKANETFVEKLLSHDTDGMSYSYAIVESPLAVKDYRSTFSVTDAGDGKARLAWRSTFEPTNPESDEATQAVLAAIYEAGLAAVKNKVAP